MSGTLLVVLYGSVAGKLTRPSSLAAPSFTYSSEYLASSTVPLSVRMPLREAPYDATRVLPFLEGILPENPQTRRHWASVLGVESDDPFSLLSKMGWDCPGAVQFCKPDELDEMLSRAAEVVPVGESDIAGRLRALRNDDTSWAFPDERWSLGGQQGKFALVKVGDGWGWAHGSAPTTHIVKAGIGRLNHQALVEHVTMRAAVAMGVRTAATEYRLFEDQPALIVARYDRVVGPSGVLRVHQEDFCSATGRFPTRKYEVSGGPTMSDMMRLISAFSSDPSADAWALLDFAAVSYIAGAPDGHSKNLSLLLLPGRTTIAPVYDLASGLPYDFGGVMTVALAIGGRRKLGEVMGKNWDRAARVLGLAPEAVRARVSQMARDFPDAYASALSEMGATGAQDIKARSLDRVARHCHQVLRQLSAGSSTVAEDSTMRATSAPGTVSRARGKTTAKSTPGSFKPRYRPEAAVRLTEAKGGETPSPEVPTRPT